MGLFKKLFGGSEPSASPFDVLAAGDIAGLSKYLEQSGDPNIRDEDNRTLLGNAADLVDGFRGYPNRIALAELLIHHGADVDAGDRAAWTPLHFAARNLDLPMATLLLQSKAAIDPRDAHGNTPLWRAVSSTRHNGDMIRLLLNAGANPNLDNNFAMSPLKCALQVANFDIKQYFQETPNNSTLINRQA